MTTPPPAEKITETIQAIRKLGYTVGPNEVVINGERRFFVNGQARTFADLYKMASMPPRRSSAQGS